MLYRIAVPGVDLMPFIVDRNTGKMTLSKPSLSQRFLYRTLLGRCILKLLIQPFISRLTGAYMNTRVSKLHIKHFAKKNHISLEEYELDAVKCFNDFFIRKIKPGKRKIEEEASILISPCDAKLSAYKIDHTSIYKIKDSYYSVYDLIENEDLAKKYEGGYCLVFRLGVSDYHRYCYFDDGHQEKNISLPGVFHTVHPISLEKYNFFKKNHRIYTLLHTLNFGDVVQVEVGAMMVGKIVNHKENNTFVRGEEKGYFKFGGSTIVLLFENHIQLDEDIVRQSEEGNEVMVHFGERIGCAL